jgi:hypothetical protein
MTLHVPTHPAGFAGHHHLGYVLLPIVAIALGVALWAAAVVVEPYVSTTSEPASQQQLYNEFRAGERGAWAASNADVQQLFLDYRAGERESWGNP